MNANKTINIEQNIIVMPNNGKHYDLINQSHTGGFLSRGLGAATDETGM